MNDGPPINVREVRAMIGFLQRAQAADTEQERDAAIDEGVVAWGYEFVQLALSAPEQNSQWQPITDAIVNRFIVWLGGARLTTRPDEDERRAVAAQTMAQMSPARARWALDALAALPDGHPLRRELLDDTRAMVRANVETFLIDGELDDALMALQSLLSVADTEDEEDSLIAQGEELLARATDEAATGAFRLAAVQVLAGRLIAARDLEDTAALPPLAASTKAMLDSVVDGMNRESDPRALGLAALAFELADEEGRALDVYLELLARDVGPSARNQALVGTLRTGVLAGRHQPVLQYAEEALASLVTEYATEPDPKAAQPLREQLDRALANVGISCAATGSLSLLLTALEMTSSARLRYRMAIRRGRGGRPIRRLEAALWSAERGLDSAEGLRTLPREGRAAASLTAMARLREAHRSEAQRHQSELTAPTIAEVTSRLRADEGVVVLGTGAWGTALLPLRRNEIDGTVPDGEILKTPLADWLDVLGPGDAPGWALYLALPWDYDSLPGADRCGALDRALAGADADVGPRIAAWAKERGVRRVWLVPHGILGMVPWWALPSLADLDVRTLPTLSLLPRARGAARLAGPVVVVGNATDDLPAAEVEAHVVAEHVRGRGLAAEVMSGGGCTEDAVSAATTPARILHFSGHATSQLTDSTRSALHLHADARWWVPDIGAQLTALAVSVGWSDTADDPDAGADPDSDADGGEVDRTLGAEVGLPGPDGTTRPGLLREEEHEGGIVLRELEYSQSGTLQAVSADGRLVRLSELWSAGDMAVSGALRDIRLAVLSACQSGGSGLDFGSDELGGLPAAMLLAGVRSIVCTGWTVDDVLSAVTADLFWELLCAEQARVVDLYALVGRVRTLVAEMPTQEAQRRIARLRSVATSGSTRFLLEAEAARLEPGRPYARPYDWAPLFVVGEPLLTWRSA